MSSDAEVLAAFPRALRQMAENAERMVAATGADRIVELEQRALELQGQVQRLQDLRDEGRRQMVHLVRQADGAARVQKVLREQRNYCSDERLDVPSWVNTMQAALDGPSRSTHPGT